MQNIMEQKMKNLLTSLVCSALDEMGPLFSAADLVSTHIASHKEGSMSAMSSLIVVSVNSKVSFLLWDRKELICEHAL